MSRTVALRLQQIRLLRKLHFYSSPPNFYYFSEVSGKNVLKKCKRIHKLGAAFGTTAPRGRPGVLLDIFITLLAVVVVVVVVFVFIWAAAVF